MSYIIGAGGMTCNRYLRLANLGSGCEPNLCPTIGPSKIGISPLVFLKPPRTSFFFDDVDALLSEALSLPHRFLSQVTYANQPLLELERGSSFGIMEHSD